ncbi:tetratricopeptide repeat protein [Adhaeribacter pallidiroseus]|uniref:Uncharacterized protein n=1 Tax=Adhaeribacter pallidiroseus TaxID=2072847 RepID=A0A369QKB9_9BACT|nr:hypothetical protein [Adhaeribacter pallidiroseus]RDC63666.1 hypothetical protein AHMF7616_02274 [Adhaeribacter pallidiroseus]
MKLVVAFTIFLAFFSQTLTKVARINHYLEEAQAAYTRKDFATAIYFYRYLNDSLQVRDREVKVNLAHAYFQRKNTQQALKYYQPLLTRTPPRISSLINLQLGVMMVPNDKTRALDYFKKALILNSQNEEARYNYELLKKYLLQHPEEKQSIPPPSRPEQAKAENLKPKENSSSGHKEDTQGSNQAEIPDLNNSDPLNLPQPNLNARNLENDANNPTTKKEWREESKRNSQQKELTGTLAGNTRGINNTGHENNNRGSGNNRTEENTAPGGSQTTYNALKEASITPEKARMLLEAMREAEVQYLQQIPRKGTKKTNSDKPNW